MQPAFRFSLFFLICTAAISCTRDKCKDTSCLNDGICLEGECLCPFGYEGEHCETAWNARFPGVWSVAASPQGTGDTTVYQVSLVASANPAQFYVMNFHEELDSIICKRTGARSFSFIDNQLRDSSLILISGSGSYDSLGNNLAVSYRLKMEDTTIRYFATWKR